MKKENLKLSANSAKKEEIINAIKNAISESYGVKGISIIKNTKGQKEEGIIVSFKSDSNFVLDIYLVVAGDVKITETLRSCQKTVRFYMEHLFPKQCLQVNLYAEEVASI